MNMAEALQVATRKGFTFKMMWVDGTFLYWIETPLFIGKPFRRLDELIHFIHTLPAIA